MHCETVLAEVCRDGRARTGLIALNRPEAVKASNRTYLEELGATVRSRNTDPVIGRAQAGLRLFACKPCQVARQVALIAWLLSGASVMAQDTSAARQAAAERYLEAVPLVLTIEETIAQLAMMLPERLRQAWVGQMRALIDKRALAEAVRDAMTQTYTLEEIQALTDFYRSPIGKAIVQKTPAYNARLQPALVNGIRRALDRAVDAKPVLP